MKEIERVGLLKMDFLGLEYPDADPGCPGGNRTHDGRDGSTSTRSALDDEKTYQLFGDGLTYGVFQFESSGMREILRKARPQRLDDLIALNALYRPGPLRSGMVDDFIARKQGRKEIAYELKQLEPILADAVGVLENRLELRQLVDDLLAALLPRDEVVDHPAAQRARAVERVQRDQVVQPLRLGLAQDVAHARAFELEHAEGQAFAEQLIRLLDRRAGRCRCRASRPWCA